MPEFASESMIDAGGSCMHGRQRFTDIHCHCLPCLDDGPDTMSESVALCRQLVEEGIASAIATPHQLGRFRNCGDSARIRDGVRILNDTLKRNGVELNVLPGSEVRVDERLCSLLEKDKIMTLADGGRYILLELPRQVCVDIIPLLEELAGMGFECIISHVERLAPFVLQNGVLLEWMEHSAHLQITASSLVGDFGLGIQKTAWNFLDSGWAALVASDSHNTDLRRPRMRAAYQSIVARLGGDIADLVCIENSLRVINGLDIVPPVLFDLEGVEQ